MNRRSTILWRMTVLGLIAGLVPLGIYALERYNQVDTDRMLDVSVSIRTMSHVTVDKFGDSVWETGNGSGFLVSRQNCEVWTNHHVIADAALIEVFPKGWNRAGGIPATVVNSTPRTDVAILELEHCDGLPQARLGNSDLVQPGDETFAVGNPLGRNPDSISRGIISHTQRYRDAPLPYLQTDAAINPGNSGGALFDREGNVIGMNTAIETTRFGTNTGVGFAVPINLVREVVAELREGPPSWGDAGFSEVVASLSADEAEVFDVPEGLAALIITETPTEGPSAGKLEAHDVIYRINGNGIEDKKQVTRMIGQHKVGETLALDVIRAGEQRSIEIVLGEGWKADAVPSADQYDGYLGMTLEMWTDKEDDRNKFKRPVITRVHSMGPAHRAHIASTQKTVFVNGGFAIPYLLDVKTVTGVAYEGEYHPIETVEEVDAFAARAFADNRPLLLEIELWVRTDPRDYRADLKHESTAFFKLVPERAFAGNDGSRFRMAPVPHVSRAPFAMMRTGASSRSPHA